MSGSKGGGGGYSESFSRTSSQAKTAEQKKWLTEALSTYGPQLGEGTNIYPEARVAPFSELQQKALTGAGRFADYFAEPTQVGTPLFTETGQATKGLLTGETGAKPLTSQNVEDYFNKAIYDPTMTTLRKDVVPGIEEAHAGPGFFGSARSQEVSEAYKDTAERLGTQRAELAWDVLGRNQALAEGKAGRSLATLGPAMAYGQVPTQEIKNNIEIAAQKIGGLNQIFGFGQAEQTQAQAELQDEIIRFAEENQITDPENLEVLLALLGMNFATSRGKSEAWGMDMNVQG